MSEPVERLQIQKFAGIKNLQIDLRPFTVLIGPQSVGKSVVAKFLYFFQRLPNLLEWAAVDGKTGTLEEVLLSEFQKYFSVSQQPTPGTSIIYSCGEHYLKISYANGGDSRWKIEVPEEIHEQFEKLRHGVKLSINEGIGSEELREWMTERKIAFSVFESNLVSVFPHIAKTPYLVPAGRAFYPQIESNPSSFFGSAGLDPFIADFGSFYAQLKGGRMHLPNPAPECSRKANQLISELIDGSYERQGTEDFIRAQDGRMIPVRHWSSGQQEAQPLTLLLSAYCAGFPGKASLFIEEPEAHLFPSSQYKMAELISVVFNARKSDSRIFITTHSPYILTTINNFMVAGQIYSKIDSSKEASKLASIVPSDRALQPGEVGAFYMDREGCRSIIDSETEIIGSSAIDEVSGRINEQFDALLELYK
jgi:hypothetical protein